MGCSKNKTGGVEMKKFTVLGVVILAVSLMGISGASFAMIWGPVQTDTNLPVLPGSEIEETETAMEDSSIPELSDLEIYPITGTFGIIKDIRDVLGTRNIIISRIGMQDSNHCNFHDFIRTPIRYATPFTHDLAALQILLGDRNNSCAGGFFPHGMDERGITRLGDPIAPGIPFLFADENGKFFDENGNLTARWCRLLSIINSSKVGVIKPTPEGKTFFSEGEVLVIFEPVPGSSEYLRLLEALREGEITKEEFTQRANSILGDKSHFEVRIEDVGIVDWRERAGLLTVLQNEDGSKEFVIVTDVKKSWFGLGPYYVHYIDMQGEKHVLRGDKFLKLLDPQYGYAAYGPQGLIWGQQ